MRKLSAGLVVAVLFLSFVSAVLAGDTWDPWIKSEIARQQLKIDRGIASGTLTRPEAAVLQDNLNWIRDREARMKADGTLTQLERMKLKKMLQRNSKMIFNKKHNPIMRVY